MSDLERRFTTGAVEIRAKGDKRMIGGYAAKFGVLSRNLGGFVEMVGPNAFNRARGNGFPGVIARHEHENSFLMGTVAARTLSLDVDDVGLNYLVDPPKTRADVVELVERGDVASSSFAFRTIGDDGDEWGLSDQGFPLRTLLSVDLIDIASVVSPAYPDATAGLRSLARHMGAEFEEVRSMAQADELRSFFTSTGPTSQRAKAGARLDPAAARMELNKLAVPTWA